MNGSQVGAYFGRTRQWASLNARLPNDDFDEAQRHAMLLELVRTRLDGSVDVSPSASQRLALSTGRRWLFELARQRQRRGLTIS
jgi:hypothetical protein